MQRVRKMLNSDRQLSVRMFADQIKIDKLTVHIIITKNVAMWKICAKLVPNILIDYQKQRWMSVCEDCLRNVQENPDFLVNSVIVDDIWMFEYDSGTKR